MAPPPAAIMAGSMAQVIITIAPMSIRWRSQVAVKAARAIMRWAPHGAARNTFRCSMIYLIATITVRSEHRADFLENARTVIAATHKEPGCQSYDLLSSVTEPNCFVFVERWVSREALTEHFGTPHLKEWQRVSKEFVEKVSIEIIWPDKVETL